MQLKKIGSYQSFSDSEQKRIKAVLSDLTLDDEKLSHLLRKMRQIAGVKINDDFLKTLWFQGLPNDMQVIFSVSDQALDKLASMAKISEVSGCTSHV